MSSGPTGTPASFSITRRVMGAATSDPKPACSTVVTTTYFGWFTGKKPANNDVSEFTDATWAVPVLPATPIAFRNGELWNAGYAVPSGSLTAPTRPLSIAPYVAGSNCHRRIAFGCTRATTLRLGVVTTDARCGVHRVPPLANAAYASASCRGVATTSP